MNDEKGPSSADRFTLGAEPAPQANEDDPRPLVGKGEREAGADAERPTVDELMAERLPLRLLVAEDHDINRMLVRHMLRRMGYEADYAANGQEVLEAIARSDYDMVMMDVQMPIMDGMQTAQAIRDQFPPDRRPVIVAVTANARKEDRIACMTSGMHDFLPKPIRLQDLQTMIEKWGRAINRMRNARLSDAAAADAPLVDPERMREIYTLGDGDPAFLQQLMDMYLGRLDGQIQGIVSHLESGDMEALALAIHSLKGESANVGAARMAQLCAEIERAAKARDAGACEAKALLLEPAAAETAEAMPAAAGALVREQRDDA